MHTEDAAKPTLGPAEPLAYDVLTSCQLDGTGRSTKYKALNPDAEKRGRLPYLPSFTVGRRRLIYAADHKNWLEQLRAAALHTEAA